MRSVILLNGSEASSILRDGGAGRERSLIVGVAAVGHLNDQHDHFLIFHAADDPVIPDPVTPQSGKLMFKGFSEAARII